MNKQDWNASHLGKKVRTKGSNYDNQYRLESLTYHYGSDSVIATLITIVPSERPGVLSHFELDYIELAE